MKDDIEKLLRLPVPSAAVLCMLLAASAEAAPAEKGKKLLAMHCARCHATGRMGISPMTKAPPLRDIYRQYPIERLEFELSEGIGSRHPKMPQIQFSTEQIDSILSYLESIEASKK